MIIGRKLGLILMTLFVILAAMPLPAIPVAAAAAGNLALGQPVTASGNEVDWLVPENAVDGDPKTRWSSALNDNQWFLVDLGETKRVSRVVIDWQTPAETYQLWISVDNVNWTNVAAASGGVLSAAAKGKDVIEFETADARFVKFQGVQRRAVEGIYYGYSFFEFEVYEERDLLPVVMAELKANMPAVSEGQEAIVLPLVRAGYKATLVGTDRLPVIDAAGNIRTPLVDAKVNLLVRVESESAPGLYLEDNVQVTVPGSYEQTPDRNAEPRVIPSLREWLGRTGDFVFSDESRIVLRPSDRDALQRTAEIVQEELRELTGLGFEIAYEEPAAGDLLLALDGTLVHLGEEGYSLDVDDYASIAAPAAKGVFYGTRTILQLLAGDDNHVSMPKGTALDYPKYVDRGFLIDVARKFYTIDFLREYVKLMAYYKMNRFQIHLNDDVGTPFEDGTRSAFRLESETYPGLASASGSYTKQEFRELQLLGMDYGVNVVPEIDTPGHSGAFIAYDPTLGSNNALDIARPETVDFVKSLFDEYIDGPNPAFVGPDVHIGTDEYFGSDKEAFRGYMDTLIRYIDGKGKRARLWGGLTQYDGATPVSNAATMDIWYEPYGSARQAVDLGYDIVNVYTNLLYIVPQLYRNYLNYDYLYNVWEPNNWVGTALPYGHPRLKGAMFALWNDVSEERGVSMADTDHMLRPSMRMVAEKTWTGTRDDRDLERFETEAERFGDPPTVRLAHKLTVPNDEGSVLKYTFEDGFADGSGNGFDGAGYGVDRARGLFGEGARLAGGDSYIETPLQSLGFGWTISLWVKPDADNPPDAVLLESPEGQLKLNQGNTGKLGFSKENDHSVFDYKVPAGKWTHLVLTGDSSGTSLFVNGSEFAQSLKGGTRLETFVLPLARIGSTTNAFKGVIDQVEVLNRTVPLDGNLALGRTVESSAPESSSYSADKAVDGRGETRWASEYTDDAWFLVDLGETAGVDKVAISWQTAYAKKYRIVVSGDKTNWTNPVKTNNGLILGKGGKEVVSFDRVAARYVKFEGLERETIFGYSFHEFEVFDSQNAIGNKAALAERAAAIGEESFPAEQYSEAGLRALREALLAAETLLLELDASKPDTEAALAALNKARDGLSVEEALAALQLNGASAVDRDLNLPVLGIQDTSIAWKSSRRDYMSDEGRLLKRPGQGEPDLSLVLTATVGKGEVTATKDFGVTIKARTDSPWEPPVSPGPGNGNSPEEEGGEGEEPEAGGEGNSGNPGGSENIELCDIAGHWAEAAVERAVSLGFVTGYGDGMFRADQPVTREQFVAMLARALKPEAASERPAFADDSAIGAWARPFVAAAVQARWIKGYEDGTFRPKAELSRAELAVLLARGLEPVAAAEGSDNLPFRDAKLIPQWATSYVKSVYDADLMKGKGGGFFDPAARTTRAEAVVAILRLLDRE